MKEGERKGPSDAQLDAAVPRDGSGREIWIGLFVLLGLVSFFTVLFLMTDPATLRGRYLAVTEMQDAGGVRRGDPVQMRGVNIGRVHGFDMTDRGTVAVTLELEGEWEVPQGSVVRLGGTGLFGGRTVEVVPGSGSGIVEEGDTIPGEADGGGGLMETAERVGGEAEVLLARLQTLLDTPTVGSVQASVRDVEGLTRELRSLLREQRDEITRLTSSMAEAAEDFEAAGPEVVSAAQRADSLMASLQATGSRLDEILASLDTVVGRMERGEGTLGRLSRDETLYTTLTSAAANLDSLLVDVRARPSRYINLSIF